MKKALLCCCKERKLLDSKKVEELAFALKTKGFEVKVVADLCEACAVSVQDISGFLNEGSDSSIVLACNERAVKSLLNFANVNKTCEVKDIKNNAIENVFEELNLQKLDGKKVSEKRISRWSAWYPTIDKTRCVNCGKCVDFCVFGVYEKIESEVRVVNPKNCKNNCPACARTCPTSAIIFPKCEDKKICGDQKIEESNSQNKDEDFLQKLKSRSASRKKFFK